VRTARTAVLLLGVRAQRLAFCVCAYSTLLNLALPVVHCKGHVRSKSCCCCCCCCCCIVLYTMTTGTKSAKPSRTRACSQGLIKWCDTVKPGSTVASVNSGVHHGCSCVQWQYIYQTWNLKNVASVVYRQQFSLLCTCAQYLLLLASTSSASDTTAVSMQYTAHRCKNELLIAAPIKHSATIYSSAV
jgi:hypothetical protein